MCKVLIVPFQSDDVPQVAARVKRFGWVDGVQTKIFIGFDSVRPQFQPLEPGLLVTTNNCSAASNYAGDPFSRDGSPIIGYAESNYRFSMRLRAPTSHSAEAMGTLARIATVLMTGNLSSKKASHFIRAANQRVISAVSDVLRSIDVEEIANEYTYPMFGEHGGLFPVFNLPCSEIGFAQAQRQTLLSIPGVTHVFTLYDA